jgi:hypothetical protein
LPFGISQFGKETGPYEYERIHSVVYHPEAVDLDSGIIVEA